MRRLNTKLLITLIVGAIVLVVSVHFLHAYQVGRNARILLTQAEEARQRGDVKTAANRYKQYLNYKTDREASIKYADLVADVAEAPDPTPTEVATAYDILTATVTRHPDLKEVRRRLVNLAMARGRLPEAKRHIETLQGQGEKRDPALDVLQARCMMATGQDAEAKTLLSKTLGFDELSGNFDPTARGAHEVDAYTVLADLLRRRFSKPDAADQLIEQMVVANPKEYTAYLARGRYLRGYGRKQGDGEQDIRTALKMAPDDVGALLSTAEVEITHKDFRSAKEILERALAKHPKDSRVYQSFAQLAVAEGSSKSAIKYIQQGLKALPRNFTLQRMMAELQLQVSDLKGVQQTMQLMRENNVNPAFIDLYDARVKVAEGKWSPAAQALEKVRPRLQRLPEIGFQIDFLLGNCYEKLNQPDRQAEAFRRAMQANPSAVEARLGYARALLKLDRRKELAPVIRDINRDIAEVAKDSTSPDVLRRVLQAKVDTQMRKPLAERNWDEVAAAAADLTKVLPAVQQEILKADLQLVKGDMPGARKILIDAQRKYPKELPIWLALLRLVGQEKPTTTAELAAQSKRLSEVLDRAERQVGDHLALRLTRANLIARKGGPDTAKELRKLERGISKFPKDHQEPYLLELGNTYLRLGSFADARRCWKIVADNKPNDLSLRVSIFELAVNQRDEASVKSAVEEVERITGPNSAQAKFCQAAYIAWQVREKKKDRSTLREARELLAQARQLRPGWHEVPRLMAELDAAEGHVDEAITNYQEAAKLGPVSQTALARLAALLYSRGRMDEIRSMAPQLSQSNSDIVRRIGVESILGTDADAAIRAAEEAAARNPDQVEGQLYLGYTLERAGRIKDAEATYRRVVEKKPSSGQAWMLLVNLLATNDRKSEAASLVPEIENAVPKKEAAGVIAKVLDLVGETAKAEKYYLAELEAHPNDLSVLRDLSIYYMRAGQRDKSKQYVDKILALGPKSRQDATFIQWAHRARAEIVAQRGSYRDLQAALKAIESSSPGGKMSPEDMLVAANLLASRPEPSSRTRAIELLEQLERTRPLSAQEDLLLAQLYERIGRWNDARRKMLTISGKAGSNTTYLTTYAKMMLKHGEVQEATRLITELERLRPEAASTLELKTRLLAKQDPAKAAAYLESHIPNNPSVEQLQQMALYSLLLENLGMEDRAGNVLRRLRAREPRATLMLAAFLGRHGDVDEAFSLFDEARKSQSLESIIRGALTTLRMRPKEVTKVHFKQVQDWIAALDPSKSKLKHLYTAHLHDIQGRYPQAKQSYRDLIAQPDVPEYIRGEAQNNLAFLLALDNPSPAEAAEALQLIQNAMNIVGPTADLLDTRAMVNIALGKASAAVADMRTVVQDDPSASKYFHLALAERKAGNRTAAEEALKKARELKFDAAKVTVQEQKLYEQMVKELRIK